MKIKILGNGGAINDGLPYNAFIIDKKLLVETPPDIMLSLARENIQIDSIGEIFISHMHGDHCFGFPFMILRFYLNSIKSGKQKKIKLYAPQKGKIFLMDLTTMALSAEHPALKWIEDNIDFINISSLKEVQMHNSTAELYLMDHYEETYAFILKKNNKNIFAYISDTKWSESVAGLLSKNPKKVIVDLNGEIDDPVPVHLAEHELIGKGFKCIDTGTIFYGTHLKYNKISNNNRIHYATPGMEIDI